MSFLTILGQSQTMLISNLHLISQTLLFFIQFLSLATSEITLTSSPPPSSNGYFCPGPVQFTCVGTEVSDITWRTNSTNFVTYIYLDGDSFPQTGSLSPPLPDVNIMITSGTDSRIESTLNADVSSLRETLIECSSTTISIENSTTVQERQGTYFTWLVAMLHIF